MKVSYANNRNPELIARAIIIKNKKILLCSGKGTERYFLPGGHVEMFETSKDALKRELKEELGMRIRRCILVGIAENIYHDGRQRRHETNLIYLATPSAYKIKSLEYNLDFSWILIDKLNEIKALPKSLFKAVARWAKDKKNFAVYQVNSK